MLNALKLLHVFSVFCPFALDRHEVEP